MKQFFHPRAGELILDHTTLLVPDFPGMRVVVFTAEPGSESERKPAAPMSRELELV
jgi:hypothetical protein